MKYYLIKAPENHLIYVEGKRNREAECVELTEEDMGALEIACDSIEAYNKECADKIRKVLE